MSLEKKFKKQLKDWEMHCQGLQFSSMIGEKIIDCEAYKNLVEMKDSILPFIHQIYLKRFTDDNLSLSVLKSHGFPKLIREIAGKYYVIPPGIRGNVKAIEIYTKQWLSEYLNSIKKD